ncbi:MAG: hypothetical protein IT282_17090, partial [Bacteroidetes bacterium]|nr:hypothetical protein [Bacteroidota bacterium]
MDCASTELLTCDTQVTGVEELHFIAYHRAARSGYQEPISRCLSDFKKGIDPQTSRWIALAAPLVSKTSRFDVIVRALRSNELAADGESPLDKLCAAIAEQSGAVYAPARLVKSRTTRMLQGLGGQAAHRKELEGVYTFSPAELKEDVRVLVVDDTMATGSTMEAISAAIKTALPAATIVGFVLGKAEGVYQNVHLNAEYFLGPERDPGHAVGAFTPAGISRKASIHKLQGTVSPGKVPATKTRVSTVRRKGNLKLYLGGLVFAFVVVGALVPLRSGRTNWQADLASMDLPDLSSSAKTSEPAEPASRQAVPVERKNVRPATITVPSVGLRANHSLSSQTLARTTVQAGEKVE